MKNMPHLGTAFCVNYKVLNSVGNFWSPNERLSFLTIRCANKTYTLINVHAPINQDNKNKPERNFFGKV